MIHSYTMELFAREQIGDWRREAAQHRLVRQATSHGLAPWPRLAAWPLLSRVFQRLARMASPA